MTERLGIFGGTFDPPHIGHQILAAEARHQLDLDRVLWVLTPDPPHKKNRNITPLPIRLALVQAAIAGAPDFEISQIEIDRPAPHYAVETMHLLQDKYPDAELVYLMGGDSLHDLPQWFSTVEFVAACHALGVMRRPADHVDLELLESEIPGIISKIRFFETPLLEISASEIQSRVRRGQPFRYFLPLPVFQIIQKKRLYRLEEQL